MPWRGRRPGTTPAHDVAAIDGNRIRESPAVYAVAVATSADWTFLSNHGHVLVALARDPGATMRDVAQQVGITERAVQLLVRDLSQAGYVHITRVGRRNRYAIATELPLRHPLERDTAIGDFLGLLTPHEMPSARG